MLMGVSCGIELLNCSCRSWLSSEGFLSLLCTQGWHSSCHIGSTFDQMLDISSCHGWSPTCHKVSRLSSAMHWLITIGLNSLTCLHYHRKVCKTCLYSWHTFSWFFAALIIASQISLLCLTSWANFVTLKYIVVRSAFGHKRIDKCIQFICWLAMISTA